MAENKVRDKMRKNRVTIDDKYLGPEPFWESIDEIPTDPIERQTVWGKAAQWYNYSYKLKEYIPYVIQYAEEVHKYNKEEIKALKACEDWRITRGVCSVARLHFRGWIHEQNQHDRMKEKLDATIAFGMKKLAKAAAEPTSPAVNISIVDRTKAKLRDTVYVEWDEAVVDGWADGDFKVEFDVFNTFKKHGLKGNAINPFKELIELDYHLIKDALDKTCEQAVEAYSHISTANKKKMIKQYETVFADLEKLRSSFKATRTVTTKTTKRKSTDAQVKKLKYKAEDNEFKITSINPVTIPGKETLYVFNTKSRTLYQYVTTATAGFEINGTSIKNFAPNLSKCTKLRKPDDVLPLILTKTPKQIESQVWKSITTKVKECNGRLNADCVLLRVV
jgi:hypothetical protein